VKALSLKKVTFGIMALIVVSVLVWQGITAKGMAVLAFVGHLKLLYKKMLILTGTLLLLVLLVMTGETAQEMQLAGWISTTKLDLNFPAWMGLWLSVFPVQDR